MSRSFTPEVEETIHLALSWGYEYLGRDGKDHPRLRWTDGQEISIAGTTGNFRTVLNDRARLRRLAGVAHDGPNAAKYKRGMSKRRRDRQPAPVVSTTERARDLRAYIQTVELQSLTPAGITEHVRRGLRNAKAELAQLDEMARGKK